MVIIVIHNHIYVFFPPFVVTDLHLVDSGNRGGIPLGFKLLLLLVFPGLIQRLGILGRSRYGNLSLAFVPAIIFYHSLSLDFVCGGMHQSIPLGNLLVSLAYIGTWL